MSNTNDDCPTKAAHGNFCWNERLTRDVERVKKFYQDTIGWTYTSMLTPTGHPGRQARRWAFPPHLGVRRRAGSLDVVSRGRRRRQARREGDGRRREADGPIFDVPNVGRIAILTEPGGAGVGWMTPAA